MTTAIQEDSKTRTINPASDNHNGAKQIHRPHQKRIHRDPALRKRPLRPLEMVPNGTAILIQLDHKRFLTNGQIGDLLFRQALTQLNTLRTDKQYQKAANREIEDLLDLKLIEKVRIFQTHRRTSNLFQSAVNILTPAGRRTVQAEYDRLDRGEVLRATPDLKQYASRKIDHELAINDVCIAIERAIWSQPGEYDVLTWYDDDLLERNKQSTRFNDFTPDAWCVIATPGIRRCPIFVEVDRGTEVVHSTTGSTKDWYTKILRYGDYLAHRYHEDPFYRELGFDTKAMANPIVLTVTTSPERMMNMLVATEKARGLGSYWYTTRDRLFHYPDQEVELTQFNAILEPIWRKANLPQSLKLMDHITGNPIYLPT